MGLCWDLPLPKGEKFLLLAMADHAHHDGSGVRPGVAVLAHKTSDSRRNVQRLLRSLEGLGLVEATAHRGGGFGRATVYRIRLEVVAMLLEGDIMSPYQAVDNTEKGDTIRTLKGDTTMQKGDTTAPKGRHHPHPNRHEPSEPRASEASDASLARENLLEGRRAGESIADYVARLAAHDDLTLSDNPIPMESAAESRSA